MITKNFTHWEWLKKIVKKQLTYFFLKNIENLSLHASETVAVKMPARNTTLKFENHDKKLPIPFVVYADFECFTKPLSTCEPYPHDSYTYSYQNTSRLDFVSISKD